ncbi:MAG: CPBP family intramembrane metalloprotease [Prevotella sp.]|nr:CPBP family intramembrane metalloprotease [Prevotella sp.]
MKKSFPNRIYQCVIIYLVYSLAMICCIGFDIPMSINLIIYPLAMVVVSGLFVWSLNRIYHTPFSIDLKMPTKQTVKFTFITTFFVVFLYILGVKVLSENEFSKYPNTWYFFLSMAILTPLAEELLFRGIFLKGLLQSYKKFWAILFSSVFFALIHYDVSKPIGQNVYSLVLALFLGIILGFMYVKTKNLWPSIFLDLSINVIGFI